MNQTIKSLGYRVAGAAVLVATSASFVGAANCDPTNATGDSIVNGVDCAAPSGKAGTLTLFGQTNSIFSVVADTLIFLVGAVSVIMLIIGGLRYVLSSGEATAVKGAKDTILYSIVGIIVAVMAFAVVSFVAGQLTK